MPLQIYGLARASFARKQLDWTNDPVDAGIVHPSYVPDVDNQKRLGDLGSILAVVQVIGKAVDDRGWCKANTIFFPNTPNLKFKNVALWRRTDGLLLILSTFPEFQGGPGKTYTIVQSFATPGLFRP